MVSFCDDIIKASSYLVENERITVARVRGFLGAKKQTNYFVRFFNGAEARPLELEITHRTIQLVPKDQSSSATPWLSYPLLQVVGKHLDRYPSMLFTSRYYCL